MQYVCVKLCVREYASLSIVRNPVDFLLLVFQLEEPLEGVVEIIGKVERGPSLLGQRLIPYGNSFSE